MKAANVNLRAILSSLFAWFRKLFYRPKMRFKAELVIATKPDQEFIVPIIYRRRK